MRAIDSCALALVFSAFGVAAACGGRIQTPDCGPSAAFCETGQVCCPSGYACGTGDNGCPLGGCCTTAAPGASSARAPAPDVGDPFHVEEPATGGGSGGGDRPGTTRQ